jgi:hypothetical protein
MKHRPFPALCERCERKIEDQTGWGVMMICIVQPQPNVEMEPRENGLLMCGYCLHELGQWICPDVDEGAA